MKIIALIVSIGVLGYSLYLFFRKPKGGAGNTNGGGYTGVGDGVMGEKPKDNLN